MSIGWKGQSKQVGIIMTIITLFLVDFVCCKLICYAIKGLFQIKTELQFRAINESE